MPSSEARIAANRRNAQASTGPRTPQGKEISRKNSLKHGLTGAGIVLAGDDAALVNRKAAAYARELNADGDVGLDLARRAALSYVRMDRAAEQQAAALAEHVNRVEADFVPPEGATPEEAARLLAQAIRVAMFDHSPEAALLRKYEAAAERVYFRCLKELRARERAAKARANVDVAAEAQAMMGSILQRVEADRRSDEEMDSFYAEMGMPLPPIPPGFPKFPQFGPGGELPFAVGKPR